MNEEKKPQQETEAAPQQESEAKTPETKKEPNPCRFCGKVHSGGFGSDEEETQEEKSDENKSESPSIVFKIELRLEPPDKLDDLAKKLLDVLKAEESDPEVAFMALSRLAGRAAGSSDMSMITAIQLMTVAFSHEYEKAAEQKKAEGLLRFLKNLVRQ